MFLVFFIKLIPKNAVNFAANLSSNSCFSVTIDLIFSTEVGMQIFLHSLKNCSQKVSIPFRHWNLDSTKSARENSNTDSFRFPSSCFFETIGLISRHQGLNLKPFTCLEVFFRKLIIFLCAMES